MLEIDVHGSGHTPGQPIQGRVHIVKNDTTADMRSITVSVVQTDNSDHSSETKYEVVDRVTIDAAYQESIDFELNLPRLAIAGFVGHKSRAEWHLDASIDVPGRDPKSERTPITVLSRPLEPPAGDDESISVDNAQRAASKAARRYRWPPTFVALVFLCVGVVPLVRILREYSAVDGGSWAALVFLVGMSVMWITIGLLILRATYRKVGPTVSIAIDKSYVTMGETLRATVTVTDAKTDTDLVACLQGVERFAIDKQPRRGVVMTYGEHVFHEQRCRVASGSTDVSFVVPEHELATYIGRATTIEWRLAVLPEGDEVRKFTAAERIAVVTVRP